MSENTIFLWTDDLKRVYGRLQSLGSYWRVEWGFRAPPESDTFVPVTGLETSERDLAARWLIAMVRSLGDKPPDVKPLLEKLRVAMDGTEAKDPPADSC